MTQYIQEASTAAVCSVADAGGTESEYRNGSPRIEGLFRQQLAAAGLDGIAESIAAGTPLVLEEAVRLSQTSLPLLGRIVQLLPYECACSTGFSRNECGHGSDDAIPPEGGITSPDSLVERVATAASLPRQVAQPLAEWETYCRQLIAFRDELGATSEPVAWYPKVNGSPDENASSKDDYTGVEVLRAVALARLLLPENVQIVAPLAALGPKLAQVALDFGATHLGFVTCDGQPLESPLAVNADELKELQRSSSPTVMKEDP
jgi:hypothetical protein